jgi:AAA domain
MPPAAASATLQKGYGAGEAKPLPKLFPREGSAEQLHEIVDRLPDWKPKINGVSAAAVMPPAPENNVGDGRQEQERAQPEELKTDSLIWYGDSPPTPPSYFVDETLPQIGVATLGGQYGAAKTFVAADLGAATMVGGEFAGNLVKRTGGVLWFAAEGENEIEMRIQAAVAARGGNAPDRQPFARQAGGVPCLAEAGALARLRALAKQAAERLKRNFNCELALIVIDTLSAAAGFDDENSASETQKVMNMLAALARETQALVLLIDH